MRKPETVLYTKMQQTRMLCPFPGQSILVCFDTDRKERCYASLHVSVRFFRFLNAVLSISLIRFSWFTSLAPGS